MPKTINIIRVIANGDKNILTLVYIYPTLAPQFLCGVQLVGYQSYPTSTKDENTQSVLLCTYCWGEKDSCHSQEH